MSGKDKAANKARHRPNSMEISQNFVSTRAARVFALSDPRTQRLHNFIGRALRDLLLRNEAKKWYDILKPCASTPSKPLSDDMMNGRIGADSMFREMQSPERQCNLFQPANLHGWVAN
jgi:hypothetical protein